MRERTTTTATSMANNMELLSEGEKYNLAKEAYEILALLANNVHEDVLSRLPVDERKEAFITQLYQFFVHIGALPLNHEFLAGLLNKEIQYLFSHIQLTGLIPEKDFEDLKKELESLSKQLESAAENRERNLTKITHTLAKIDLQKSFEKIAYLEAGNFGEVTRYRVADHSLIPIFLYLKLIEPKGDQHVAIKRSKNSNLKEEMTEEEKQKFKEATEKSRKEGDACMHLWNQAMRETSFGKASHCIAAVPGTDTELNQLLICKFASKGSADKFIETQRKSLSGNPSPDQVKRIALLMTGLFKDCFEGMLEAHRAGIIHADLSAQNILVDETDDGKFIAYVSDFGQSERRPQNEQYVRMARDSVMQIPRMDMRRLLGDLSIATDLYSMQIVMLEFLLKMAGSPIFPILKFHNPQNYQYLQNPNEAMLETIKNQVYKFIDESQYRVEVNKVLLLILREMETFLKWDPSKTPDEQMTIATKEFYKMIERVEAAISQYNDVSEKKENLTEDEILSIAIQESLNVYGETGLRNEEELEEKEETKTSEPTNDNSKAEIEDKDVQKAPKQSGRIERSHSVLFTDGYSPTKFSSEGQIEERKQSISEEQKPSNRNRSGSKT